jgi:hypothetical protein
LLLPFLLFFSSRSAQQRALIDRVRADLHASRAERETWRSKARVTHNRFLLLSEDAAARAQSLGSFISLRHALAHAEGQLAVAVGVRAADLARATHALATQQTSYDNARAHAASMAASNEALAREHAAALQLAEQTALANGELAEQLEMKIMQRDAFGEAYAAVAHESARIAETDRVMAEALDRVEAEVLESSRSLAAAQTGARATEGQLAALEQALAHAAAVLERAARDVDAKQAQVHAAAEEKATEKEGVEAVVRQREVVAEQVRDRKPIVY